MARLRLVPIFLLLLAAAPRAFAAAPNDACNYITGFMMLAAALPDTVGACTDAGHYLDPGADPQDFVQHTTGGILVRRTFNLEPAFTDGYQTWAVDPQGHIQWRLNDDQFAWETIPHVVPRGVHVGTTRVPCIAHDMNLAHCEPVNSAVPGPFQQPSK